MAVRPARWIRFSPQSFTQTNAAGHEANKKIRRTSYGEPATPPVMRVIVLT